MLEIEIKAKLLDRQSVKEALLAQGFQKMRVQAEKDIYYHGVNRNFANTDEALRLRFTKQIESGAQTAYLTYKGPKLDAVSQMRKEIEAGVLEPLALHNILCALGHTPVRTVEKTREYYVKEALTACLDRVDGLGDYIELETMRAEHEGKEAAVEDLFALLTRLGVEKELCTRKSYLEMLLETQ